MNYCDVCETCSHCLKNGCVPLRTEDGGEQFDTDRPSMFSNPLFWATAVSAGLAWALVGWFLK